PMSAISHFFIFNPTHTTEIYTLSYTTLFRSDSERIREREKREAVAKRVCAECPVRQQCLEHALALPEQFGIWGGLTELERADERSEEHTSELQSRFDLVCRLLLEKKKKRVIM